MHMVYVYASRQNTYTHKRNLKEKKKKRKRKGHLRGAVLVLGEGAPVQQLGDLLELRVMGKPRHAYFK